MGDLIDTTPKDIISRVYLEQKMFETWYHGRTVLLGDACHKMLPSAGQGKKKETKQSFPLQRLLSLLLKGQKKRLIS